MKDPTRLMDVQTGRGLQLLRASRAVPAPPPEAYEKTIATLNAQASVAVAVSPAIAIAKWIVLGVVIGAGGSAIAFVASGAGPAPVVLPAIAPSSTPAPSAVPARQAEQHGVSPPAPVFGPTKVSSRPAAVASAPNTLTEEIAALDRIRRALSHHEAGAAIVSLDDYVARFPAGQLTPEAALLRVRALNATGKAAEAQSLAEKLLEQSPDRDYAARVREAASGARP